MIEITSRPPFQKLDPLNPDLGVAKPVVHCRLGSGVHTSIAGGDELADGPFPRGAFNDGQGGSFRLQNAIDMPRVAGSLSRPPVQACYEFSPNLTQETRQVMQGALLFTAAGSSSHKAFV
jgi:hypothetical protein